MTKKFDLTGLVPEVEVVEVPADSVTLEKSLAEAMVAKMEAGDEFVQAVIDLANAHAAALPKGFAEALVPLVEAFAAVGDEDEDPEEPEVPEETEEVAVVETDTHGPIRKVFDWLKKAW